MGEVDTPDVLSQIVTNPKVDHLIYTDGAVVWNVHRRDYKESGMHKFIGTRIYKHMTARNANTTRKIYEIMQECERLK